MVIPLISATFGLLAYVLNLLHDHVASDPNLHSRRFASDINKSNVKNTHTKTLRLVIDRPIHTHTEDPWLITEKHSCQTRGVSESLVRASTKAPCCVLEQDTLLYPLLSTGSTIFIDLPKYLRFRINLR